MATPQETRFVKLALSRKALSREQLKTCISFQEEKARQGSKIPLWDCTVLQNMLDQNVAEKLQDQAGDLNADKLGEFTVVRKLGEGGMGSVWYGQGPKNEDVAIKLLPPQMAKQRPFLTRFFREAQATIKLQHENIVRGVAVGEDTGNYYFAMEFIDGQSVRQMIDGSGPMDVEEATRIVRQVAEGLAYAHENNIIHRDIKPDNIMVTKAGVAKLADLGLARQTDSELTALTRTGTGMGTPYYMAPEQSADAKRADARSDLYSLGATWYHMITGEVPFTGSTALEILQKHIKQPVKSPQAVRPGIPRGVSMAIERMLAKKPEDRIQSARELCKLIDEHCLGERSLARDLGLDQPKVKESMWDMQISAGGRLEKRRFALSEVRSRIRKGQITRDTPSRPAGSHDAYQPAGSFRQLTREFPQDYASRVEVRKEADTTTARAKMHQLVTQFDSAERSYGRRKALQKLKSKLITFGVVVAIVVLVWVFRSDISGLVAKLLNKPAPPP